MKEQVTRYKKKPVVIEAVQLNWKNWNEVCDFLGSIISKENPGRNSEDYSDKCGEVRPYIELTIPTLEGNHIAKHGDWIIKGVNGEFYPCKPDIFEKTYEPANLIISQPVPELEVLSENEILYLYKKRKWLILEPEYMRAKSVANFQLAKDKQAYNLLKLQLEAKDKENSQIREQTAKEIFEEIDSLIHEPLPSTRLSNNFGVIIQESYKELKVRYLKQEAQHD